MNIQPSTHNRGRANGKGFVIPTFDTTPNYVDTHPHPVTPVRWTYRAIYRSSDRQFGVWSNPASLLIAA